MIKEIMIKEIIFESTNEEIDEYIKFLEYMGEDDMLDKDYNPFEDRLIDEF